MTRSSIGIALLMAGALGCGDDASINVAVELTSSTRQGLDPFAADVGLDAIQIRVTGNARGEEAIALIRPDERAATISGYPVDGDDVRLNVQAEGLDAQGSLISFGRAPVVTTSGDVTVRFPLRRNLAYVTHVPNAGQQNPEAFVYALDLASRSLVEKIRLPGTAPRGEWVTARGGESMLVTYSDGAETFLGILSAEDHSWRSIPLPFGQRVALGVEGSPIGIVAGGGTVTFVDLDEATVIRQESRLIGGEVLDGVISGDGSAALFVLGGVTRGTVIFADLVTQTVEPLDPVSMPAGVALSADGRIAFVTSSIESVVAEVDLLSGRVVRASGFQRPVGRAAFSDNMQAVLALDADPSNGRVLALLPRANCPEDLNDLCGQALPLRDATPTTERPIDLAADGVGRQVLVVGSGSSTTAAGLTLIETFEGLVRLPIGARSLYPGDPDDTITQGNNLVGRQRYQPRSVGIIYGR